MPSIVQSILQVSDTELAYVTTDNRAFYRAPDGTWSDEFEGAQSIAFCYSPFRIGVLDTGGTFWVKEGSPDATWGDAETSKDCIQGLLATADPAHSVGRIAYLSSGGVLRVKEGSKTADWTLEASPNVASSLLRGNVIGVLDSAGSGSLKNGTLSDKWFSIGDGLSQIDLLPTFFRAGYAAYSRLARVYSSGELTLTYYARDPEYATNLQNVVQVVVNQSPATFVNGNSRPVQLQVAALTSIGEFYAQYYDMDSGVTNQAFQLEATGVANISLSGNTLGYIDGEGAIFVKTLPNSQYSPVASRNNAPQVIARESYHLLPRKGPMPAK